MAVAVALITAAYGQPKQGTDTDSSTQKSQTQIAPQPEPKPEPITPPIILIQNDINRIAKALEAANAHPNAATEEQQARDNLQAQRDIDKWAWIMIWIAGGETAVTLIGVILVGFTLAATRRAANAAIETVKHMRENAWTELRAYVGHEPGGVRFDSGGPVRYYQKNFGRTPAKDIEMFVRIVDGSAAPPVLDDVLLPTERQKLIGYAPTGQNIGRLIETPNDRKFTHDADFFCTVMSHIRTSLIVAGDTDLHGAMIGAVATMEVRLS